MVHVIICLQGELASYINLQIKETQTKKTLQHLRSKVTGLSDLTHDPNRKLVKEGQVYLKNVKKLYQVVGWLPWKPALARCWLLW